MAAPSQEGELVTVTRPPVSRAASPFAPFRHRVFFWLWLGVVCSSIGTWAQTVGAQWLFVNDPHATTIVPLVQTASTLPMMLLALPAGVLADAFDRRWMLLAIQVYFDRRRGPARRPHRRRHDAARAAARLRVRRRRRHGDELPRPGSR